MKVSNSKSAIARMWKSYYLFTIGYFANVTFLLYQVELDGEMIFNILAFFAACTIFGTAMLGWIIVQFVNFIYRLTFPFGIPPKNLPILESEYLKYSKEIYDEYPYLGVQFILTGVMEEAETYVRREILSRIANRNALFTLTGAATLQILHVIYHFKLIIF